MKTLGLIVLIFSQLALASNISSHCLREHGVNNPYSSQLCTNVANTCYVEFRKTGYLKNEARSKCLNVANTCFSQVNVYHSIRLARKACFDIGNTCFVTNRRKGYSIKKSILKCNGNNAVAVQEILNSIN